MIRARIRVDGRLAGGLQALLGAPMAAYSGCGERDGGIGHGKRRSRTGMARVGWDVQLAGWRVSGGRAPSGWEWNGSQSSEGAIDLLLPRPALGKMEGEPACPWPTSTATSASPAPRVLKGASVALRAPPKSALDGLIKVDPVKRLLTRRFRSRRCIYSTVPRPSGGRHHCP